MATQRASLTLCSLPLCTQGRWSLWLLLLGLVMSSASAQTLSYREAVLHAVDRLNERSSEANLYRLLELDLPPKAMSQVVPDFPQPLRGEGVLIRAGDGDPDTPKPVSFTVKETVCPRTSQQPPEQCDFKENGLMKQCVGTVTLDQVKGQMNIICEELQSVGRFKRLRKKIGKAWGKIGPIAGLLIRYSG